MLFRSTHDAGVVGQSPEKKDDTLPDYLKGTPSATPPGAKPPVGSEPMKKLKSQPAQQGSAEQPEGKTGKNQMPLNKGSVGVQQYEETESEDEEVVSEEKGEGHEDAAEDKAMIKKAIQKEKMKEKKSVDCE